MSKKSTPKKSFGKKMATSISKLLNEPGYLGRKILRKKPEKEFIAIKSYRSESENGLYIKAVTDAVKSSAALAQFKRHPHYRAILEHVTVEQAQVYLDIARQQSPELLKNIEAFKINDIVGNPDVHSFPGVGIISPTTLRYIKVASDLLVHFGAVDSAKIAEIGVGYGGQCLIYDQVARFKSYHLYDLPPVLELVEKYLESHLLRSSYKTSTLNQNDGGEDYDLVISNYAFSELPSQVQMRYIEKIISKAKRGYLTMNSGLDHSCFTENKLSLDDLRRLLPPFEILEERPLTFPNNYIIVWGHHGG